MQRCVYFRDDEDFRKKYVVFTTIFPSSEEARWCFQVQFFMQLVLRGMNTLKDARNWRKIAQARKF